MVLWASKWCGFEMLGILFYLNYPWESHEFLTKLKRLMFFGVLTVFLVNDVSWSFDLKKWTLVYGIDLVLVSSALVLCLSLFYEVKVNRLNSSGDILSLILIVRVLLRKSIEPCERFLGRSLSIGTVKSCFPNYF